MPRKRLQLAGRTLPRTTRGQSLVEFALISIVLFFLSLGIIDLARLLFAYSVVSNAAQEGSRYGIVRPRDVINSAAATATAAAGGQRYIPLLVVAPGNCNIVDKTQEKALGIDRTRMNVRVWYDTGNTVPISVTSNVNDPNFYDRIVLPGNRLVVEANYRFEFIVPFLGALAPNGINISMRSARTIVNDGSRPANCTASYVPPPTNTPVPPFTPTRTPTKTPTPSLCNASI